MIGGLAVAAALAGCASVAHPVGHAHAASTPSLPPVTQTYSFNPAQVTGSGSCDVSLASDLYGQDYLTATVTLTNANTLAGTATVTVSWPLQGFSPLTKSKTVSIAANGGTADVELHVAANQSQVSEFQDEQLSAAGQTPGGPCSYSILANP